MVNEWRETSTQPERESVGEFWATPDFKHVWEITVPRGRGERGNADGKYVSGTLAEPGVAVTGCTWAKTFGGYVRVERVSDAPVETARVPGLPKAGDRYETKHGHEVLTVREVCPNGCYEHDAPHVHWTAFRAAWSPFENVRDLCIPLPPLPVADPSQGPAPAPTPVHELQPGEARAVRLPRGGPGLAP